MGDEYSKKPQTESLGNGDIPSGFNLINSSKQVSCFTKAEHYLSATENGNDGKLNFATSEQISGSNDITSPDALSQMDGVCDTSCAMNPVNCSSGGDICDGVGNDDSGGSLPPTEQSKISFPKRASPKIGKRNRKRKTSEDLRVKCPICGSLVLPKDLANHIACEMSKLDHVTRRIKTANSSKKVKSMDEDSSHRRYQTYLRIRYNREKRHHVRRKEGERQTTCPVCSMTITGTPSELSDHVEKCLNGDGEMVDVEDDNTEEDEFEEYTWAGQTRIRATSLLEGGITDLGFSSSSKANNNDADSDVDLDVDIDGDSSQLYGSSQYSEVDLKPCISDEPDEEIRRTALREALLECESCGGSAMIDALKETIRNQQKQIDSTEQQKCLICMDSYSKPLVSIQCWHVHCEDCWLRTLGAKKLCPQCNMITSPNELRRIYL